MQVLVMLSGAHAVGAVEAPLFFDCAQRFALSGVYPERSRGAQNDSGVA
jgi:hypothetical protein